MTRIQPDPGSPIDSCGRGPAQAHRRQGQAIAARIVSRAVVTIHLRPAFAGICALVRNIGRWLHRNLLDSYQPELHYMRGPGPRSHEKDARRRGLTAHGQRWSVPQSKPGRFLHGTRSSRKYLRGLQRCRSAPNVSFSLWRPDRPYWCCPDLSGSNDRGFVMPPGASRRLRENLLQHAFAAISLTSAVCFKRFERGRHPIKRATGHLNDLISCTLRSGCRLGHRSR